MYEIITQKIPQSKRTEINKKILLNIANGKGDFNKEAIYNTYTGIGGLHGLKQEDFANRATVFGIEKQNQDIYNKDNLTKLIAYTIITKKFKEFAGEKYEVLTHYVQPSKGEKAVYRTVLEEFFRIVYLYFTKMDDSRKESQMRLIRQIQLLIKACSIPNHMMGYFGDIYPSKAHEIAYLIESLKGKVAIGCTTRDALDLYEDFLSNRFPQRPLFTINGDVTFKRREKIINQFESTSDGTILFPVYQVGFNK